MIYGQRNIIVVGGNAAGCAAAAKAKRTAPNCRVLLFEAGSFISTGTCELPYVLSGEIKDYNDIIFFSPESFFRSKGVEVFVYHYVEQISRREKTIFVKNLIDGKKYKYDYDRLILCTGSIAKRVSSLNSNFQNHFYLKTVSDYLRIKNYLNNNIVKKVLIIGAGYIGLEAAEAFKKLNLDVTILEKTELPMPNEEEEVRELIQEVIKKNGVEFYGNVSEFRFNYIDGKITNADIDGRLIEFDLYLSAIGVEPNNELALSARLDLGEYGGMKVDNRLRTSDMKIYAAGDNIEVINKVTGRPTYIPIATHAHNHGHIAGANAAGGNNLYEPVVKNIAVKIFDNVLVSVGLTLREAFEYGFKAESVFDVAQNLVPVMPGSNNVCGKVIYDSNSKMILGATFFGYSEVIGYGDVIATFIHNKIKVNALSEINYSYTPPSSPLVNLLSILGRKIKKDMK
ncbi:MAG: hypothetical protein A2V66_08355 [Ignavibacteria bacterium RBG_13_36_8]|nr:MAG: hypothetical protein A2V66_08355 [Ignavibacteria bacterium RBG_13_36_8]